MCRALKNLNKFRLHGKQITLAWAPGKGMKEKQWKEFWDLDAGASFIPIEKLDPQVEIFENQNPSLLATKVWHCGTIDILRST